MLYQCILIENNSKCCMSKSENTFRKIESINQSTLCDKKHILIYIVITQYILNI